MFRTLNQAHSTFRWIWCAFGKCWKLQGCTGNKFTCSESSKRRKWYNWSLIHTPTLIYLIFWTEKSNKTRQGQVFLAKKNLSKKNCSTLGSFDVGVWIHFAYYLTWKYYSCICCNLENILYVYIFFMIKQFGQKLFI